MTSLAQKFINALGEVREMTGYKEADAHTHVNATLTSPTRFFFLHPKSPIYIQQQK